MKRKKNCHVCKKQLDGIRTKFCGDVCYLKHKSECAKKQKELMRRKYPPRNCTVCDESFYPLRDDVTACSKPCSRIQAKRKQQIRREKLAKFVPEKLGRVRRVAVKKDAPIEVKRVNVAEFRNGDPTKRHVLKYLQSGGTILKFPPDPRAKTPDVSIKFGHTSDELMGFGLEFDYDELIEIDAL